MTTKKRWIGRVILGMLILATAGVLAYMYATNENYVDRNTTESQQRTSQEATKEEEEDVTGEATSFVKDTYRSYLGATYEQEEPDFDKALDEFKARMTPEGADALGDSAKDQDPVLCSVGKPEKLSYAEPTVSGQTVIVGVVATMKSGTTTAMVTVDTDEMKISDVSCV